MSKILIVDDDIGVLEAISCALELEGYTVAVTAKGNEVYGKVDEFYPDLIILDILLSGRDGRYICRELKKQAITKKIPIIMVSAHPSIEKTVKNFGANDFLAKPFKLDQLLSKVEKNLLRAGF